MLKETIVSTISYKKRKGKQLYWQYITRTPRRHCFKAEIKCASRPQKKSSVFGYRNYSGLIFLGWLNGLIIVYVTNVPPSRHVSLRRVQRKLQLSQDTFFNCLNQRGTPISSYCQSKFP